MRNNALYFPYISLPDEAWTIKTLLYWDKVSSIVPMDYIERPDELGSFMQQLVHEGLVEQIFPARFIYKIREFEQCFINFIEHKIHNRPARSEHQPRINRPVTRIHIEKLGNIPDFLVENGLAKRINGSWYDIERSVANIFMAYLATCLGAIPEINAAPVTNKAMYASLFSNSNLSRNNEIHHEKSRNVILRSLLPTPNQNVTIDQLLRFKERHGHLLPALRRTIEVHSALIAALPNADDRADAAYDFIERSHLEIHEIVDAMKPTWNKIAFGSIAPLFGAGISLGAAEPENHLVYAGAAISFTAAAYQAIASIRDDRIRQLTKPLAYIAHARSGAYA